MLLTGQDAGGNATVAGFAQQAMPVAGPAIRSGPPPLIVPAGPKPKGNPGLWDRITGAVGDVFGGRMVGIPALGDGSPASLRVVLDVAENPVVTAVAGPFLRGTVQLLRGTLQVLDVAWDVLQHPEPYIAQIEEGLGRMIAGAGPLATRIATAAVPAAATPIQDSAVDCVRRHLEPKIDFVMASWWTVLKGMGWDLLWPWPGVAEDFGNAWTYIKAAGSHLWELDFSAAHDDLLAVLRYVNAAAGLAFAAEVGFGLLVSTAIIEGSSIAKAASNLRLSGRTPDQRECDCEIIASSSLTLGITGAMVLLGGLAARFGKAIATRIFNRVFRRHPLRYRDPKHPRARGDVLADWYVLSELVKKRFSQRKVTVTDALSTSPRH